MPPSSFSRSSRPHPTPGDRVPHCPCTNLTASAYQTPAMSRKTPPEKLLPYSSDNNHSSPSGSAHMTTGRQMIKIIRQTSPSPENHTGVNLFFQPLCVRAPTFSSPTHIQKEWQDKRGSSFVLPLCSDMYAKTVTCGPRPHCFNNTSLDPPMRGAGPDMRRCDSSGAANIIAGFSFDWLAGCVPQRTFF